MASSTAKVTFRIAMVVLLLLVLFYVGRPLYWKISATVHDIRNNKQTVKQGLSQIVLEAQKTVGWYHDESDPGVQEDRAATARRFISKIL
ncbi:Low-density receptor-like protein [Fagus crenata]